MDGEETFGFLRQEMAGLPQLEAVNMIDAEGALINHSRSWPVPRINVADRDYFLAMISDPERIGFVGQPTQNRVTGTWNIYVARRVSGPAGEFYGLILAATSGEYFESFYKSISLGEGSEQSMAREDGTLLARYPSSHRAGADLNNALPWTPRKIDDDITQQGSLLHSQTKIRSAENLTNSSLVVRASLSEQSVLRSWRKTVQLLIGFTCAITIFALLTSIVTLRIWKQQDLLLRADVAKAASDLDRLQLEAELLREREHSAEAASKAKSSFFAIMSHEIRTPMNAVIGMTGVLLETSLSHDQRNSVQAIHSASENLQDILDNILDFSRLEAGNFPVEERPFSPASLISTTLAIVRQSIHAKGLTVSVNVSQDIPQVLLGDAGRLRQILLNLLSNAIKFTPTGGIVIDIDCLWNFEKNVCLSWTVTDTGVGISEDRIGLLFNDFVQADSSVNRQFGGSGLGLAICGRILERMGGRISVLSEPGCGSTFGFQIMLPIGDTLPLDDPNQEAIHNALKECILRAQRPIRVLVADDNATNRTVIRMMLATFDVSVTEVEDGAQAIVSAKNTVFDFILMDMQMPGMDGLAATAAIRACGGWNQEVPIFAFTANAFADANDACLHAGMTGLLIKPVRKDLLVKSILHALTDRKIAVGFSQTDRLDVHWAPFIAAGDPEISRIFFDPASLDILRREIGKRTADEIYGEFIAETKTRLERLAMFYAMDKTTVAREAHSLKSAASTFGFCELRHVAEHLERVGDEMSDEETRAIVDKLNASFCLGKIQSDQMFDLRGV